jgi:predicted O-methyltransferase YrrM
MDAAWAGVDHYLESMCIGHDEVLEAVLHACDEAGLPRIAVSPLQGRLLSTLVTMGRARRVLEVGTLGGYSTICMARAVMDGGGGAENGGKVVTLELSELHARVARENFARAGVQGVIDLLVGPGTESMDKLIESGAEPFDFVFIDADKPSTPAYFERARKLTKQDSVIVVDNVVRDGHVVNATSDDASILGIRKFFEMAKGDPAISMTAVQTVGSKGYDGFAIAVVR